MSRARALLALLCALVMLAPAGVAATDDLVGTVESTGPVDLDGRVDASMAAGALHLRAEELTNVVDLRAEHLEAHVDWEEGYRAGPSESSGGFITDAGEETRSFTDARLRIGAFQGNPEILALVDEQAHATAASTTSALADVVSNRDLTQVGWSDETASTDDGGPGFWYHVDGPWVHLAQMEQATVKGTFTLFVNNVTLEVSSADGSWQTWTGYRESAEDLPASRYEQRVTVLTVHQGALDLSAPGEVNLLGSLIDTTVDGTIQAPGSTGELLDAVSIYDIQDGPLVLEGTGALALEPGRPGASARGAVEQPNPGRIQLAPSGDYQLAPNAAVTEMPRTDGGAGDGSPLLWYVAGALLLAGVLAVLVTRPAVLHRIDALRADLRERRVNAWMRTGDRLTAVRDYEKALGWYRRLTDTYPAYAEGWYAQAVTQAELGRHGEASTSYETAGQLMGGDDPEMIDLAATSAAKAGGHDRARQLFEELARLDPQRARTRLSEPAIQDTFQQSWVDRLFDLDEEASSSYV